MTRSNQRTAFWDIESDVWLTVSGLPKETLME